MGHDSSITSEPMRRGPIEGGPIPSPLTKTDKETEIAKANILTPPTTPAVKPRASSQPIQMHERSQKLLKTAKESGDAQLYTTLSKTYTHKLPPPARSDKAFRLWRGCRADQLMQMATTHSAGGSPLNPDVKAPPESMAKRQVGEQQSLPEFTSIQNIAKQFGTGNFVAVFEIEKRYLTEGSKSEGGWITEKEAPVKLVAWCEGRDIEPLPSPTRGSIRPSTPPSSPGKRSLPRID